MVKSIGGMWKLRESIIGGFTVLFIYDIVGVCFSWLIENLIIITDNGVYDCYTPDETPPDSFKICTLRDIFSQIIIFDHA